MTWSGTSKSEWWEYIPNYLSREQSLALFESILEESFWEQRQINMFGKRIPIPRKECFFNETELVYSYSGVSSVNRRYIKQVKEIQTRIEKDFGYIFNCCLANLYQNGQDSNGWHADNESALGPLPIIASVSLGAEREFLWRSVKDSSERYSQILQNGSLFIMKAGFQERYQHALPKRKKVTEPRLNLTFRQLIGS